MGLLNRCQVDIFQHRTNKSPMLLKFVFGVTWWIVVVIAPECFRLNNVLFANSNHCAHLIFNDKTVLLAIVFSTKRTTAHFDQIGNTEGFSELYTG